MWTPKFLHFFLSLLLKLLQFVLGNLPLVFTNEVKRSHLFWSKIELGNIPSNERGALEAPGGFWSGTGNTGPSGLYRSVQEPPEASRSLQKPPGASRSLQKSPEVSRSLQEAPGAPRSPQTPPGVPRSLQEPPGASPPGASSLPPALLLGAWERAGASRSVILRSSTSLDSAFGVQCYI